jgi:uncharacterized protein (TIGR03000 family)
MNHIHPILGLMWLGAAGLFQFSIYFQQPPSLQDVGTAATIARAYAAAAQEKLHAAKAAYDLAAKEAEVADRKANVAEADYRTALAKEAAERAAAAHALAKQADADKAMAEKLAAEARAKVDGTAVAGPPLGKGDKAAVPDVKKELPPEPGTIVVTVAADATVTIGGQKTSLSGVERAYKTPDLEHGKDFAYTIAVTVNGKTVERQAIVRAGKETRLDFTTTK